MRSLLGRLVGIGLVGLVLFGIAAAWRSRGAARYAAAQERATAECRAYRTEPRHVASRVCRVHDEFGPSATALYTRAKGRLDEAEAKLQGARDPRGAEAALDAAMGIADDVDRQGTLVATVVAASLVNRTLDILDAHPELDRSRIVGRARLESASRPLEATRLHHAWTLAHWRALAAADEAADVSVVDANVGAATLADAMEADSAAYRAMERALLDGDDEACRAAARGVGAALGGSGLALVACDKLAPALRTSRRLDHSRAAMGH